MNIDDTNGPKMPRVDVDWNDVLASAMTPDKPMTDKMIEDIRNEALEEAAMRIEKHSSRNTVYDKSRRDAASNIRALKT